MALISQKYIDEFPELESRFKQEEFRLIKNGTHSEFLRVTKLPKVWHRDSGEKKLVKIIRLFNFDVTTKYGMKCIWRQKDYDAIGVKLRSYFFDYINTQEFMAIAKEHGVKINKFSCPDWAKANPDFALKCTESLWMKTYVYDRRAVEEYIIMLADKHPKFVKLSQVINDTCPKKKAKDVHRTIVKRALLKLGILETKLYNKLWITREDKRRLIDYLKTPRKKYAR